MSAGYPRWITRARRGWSAEPTIASAAPPSRAVGAGFTMIELLIAVSIFSLIAVAGIYILRQATLGAEQQISVVNSTSELQQALWLLSQDMYNLIDRPAQVGDRIEGAIHTKQEGESNSLGDNLQLLLNLTRLSWIDDRYKYTSRLQRVAYALRLDDSSGLKQLVPLHWPYVDRYPSQKPFERILINRVRKASISFYSEGRKDLPRWPADSKDDEEQPALPDGFKFSLTIDGYGEFEKIIAVKLDTVVVEQEEEQDDQTGTPDDRRPDDRRPEDRRREDRINDERKRLNARDN